MPQMVLGLLQRWPAVSVSEKLWIVSASRATDPVINTTISCAKAVRPRATRLILTARIPSALAASAESTESAASWLCGRKSDNTKPFKPLGC